MLTQLPANKIGMTQIFDSEKRVVPVTVIEFSHWFVTQVKTKEKDGYAVLQLGRVRKRYRGLPFLPEWLKKKKRFFVNLKEMSIADTTAVEQFKLGQQITLKDGFFEEGALIDVSGISKGLGFQGVIKRWGFSGGPKSHGSTFHNTPGSIGNMATQGTVRKGTKLPGQTGNQNITVKNLQIVRVDKDFGYVFIKGAVPGKKDSLVIMRKQG